MKILYAAIDQSVPSAHGGAVHVTAVANGLAALGHDVHAVVTPGPQSFPEGVRWWPMSPPFNVRALRLWRAGAMLRLARAIQPDVIVERYDNFGGEGVVAAHRMNIPAVLEVNAPVVDYPGSAKQRLDRLLLIRPMQRWRDWQCRTASLIVTPSAKILPPSTPPQRVLQVEWGADTDRFHPNAAGRPPFSRSEDERIVVFAGAFRAWHGAIHLVEAIRQLRARGRVDIKAVLIGDGPELARVRQRATGVDGITFTGAVPHESMPAYLASADIGAAPFDLSAHPALASEFYWSPLKIFEYMAAGLPVVLPRIARLADVVRDGVEGALYDASDPQGLATALASVADSPARQALAAAARDRAVQRFSWDRHCRLLDRALRACVEGHSIAEACAS